MAVPSNTQSTYATVGNREDLENAVYKVTASKTPFTANIGKEKVSATYHEWQTLTLRAANPNNAFAQGDTTANSAPVVTVRPGNRTQIFKDVGSVAGTQQAVDHAGVNDELAWQKFQKAEAVATDIEARFLGNYASVAGTASVAAESAGALAFMTSNVSRGTGGASGGYATGAVTAATNGTQRAFTEVLFKTVLASSFSNGARPSQIYMGATHKQQFSAFTGIAQIRKDAGSGQATIVGGADVYVSDFGELRTVPTQYGLNRDVLIIDPSMWAVGTLRPMMTENLAKVGDAQQFHVVTEKTLIARNERGSAVIADLT